jgi:Phasin protein/Hemerythrin HHE cation binding domain
VNIAQVIQSGPAKASELFAKLADTSNGAVKTREKLFSELRDELELLTRLEEEHLFPVLRKHPETKDLVPEARKDNKQVRAILAELEYMPKESEDFLKRVTELKRVFQQHVRDEKKELLPAVRKVLSEEEAQTVVEGIEAGREEAEAAKRQEIEERRAEAKREREEEERRQAEAEAADRQAREAARAARVVAAETANAGQQAARASAEIAQSHAETVRQIMQSSLGMATQAAERSVEQFTSIFGLAGKRAEETAQQSSRNIKAIAECNAVLARGFQDLSREWASLAQDQLRKNLDAFNAVLRSRSWPDLVAAQSSLARDNLELLVTNTRRLAELSIEVASEAAEKITAEAEESAKRLRRAA